MRLKLYKGLASVVGRKSADSLYSERHVTFEDDAGAYDQQDAQGFITSEGLETAWIGGSVNTKFITGIGALDSRMLILVDIERLMTSADMALMDSSSQSLQ